MYFARIYDQMYHERGESNALWEKSLERLLSMVVTDHLKTSVEVIVRVK